ncbi:MAG: chemotaxis protein [Thaumarchaeota archaeon]|nr:chemotaxis protein [Nitrososphaerota archaeon]
MTSKTKKKKVKSKTTKTTKKEPTSAAVLKKVATVSDSTKMLSKEIKAMTKIFSENQKVLVTMKNMIDSLTSALEYIQKQSKQINILEDDTQKLFAGLNQVKGQSNLVIKINDQTARLQEEIAKIREGPSETEKLSQKVSQSTDSIKNNSQMIIKIAQRIDEVRDDLRNVSAKTDTSSSVSKDLGDIRRKIESISGKAEQIQTLNGVIDGLKQQFQTVTTKAESLVNLSGKIDTMESEISSLVKRADSSAFVGEGLKSIQSDFSDFKENVYKKTSAIVEKVSSISDLIKRSEASTSEFHSKTDKVFQELQELKGVTNKASSDTSKEMMALLKLSEFQSNIRMNAESKYGELKDIENMADQTTQIINLFDKLSIEAQEKMPIPHEVRQWAVSKIFDCADKWEVRFSDVFNILTNSLGRDLLKEAIRIRQVRDIFGIRAVDEIRKELNIS